MYQIKVFLATFLRVSRVNKFFQIPKYMKNVHKFHFVWAELEMKTCFLGQPWTKYCRQYTKLRNIGFSMKCFTAVFFAILQSNCQNVIFSRPASIFPAIPSFQGLPWNFLTSHDPKSKVVWQLVRQFIHSPFGDNNLVSSHFWWTEIALKCEKVYKYFFHDCSEDFLKVFNKLFD